MFLFQLANVREKERDDMRKNNQGRDDHDAKKQNGGAPNQQNF